MEKINDIYIEKLDNDEYLVKEFNEEKGCYYVASYTDDEIECFFDIKKEDLK